MPRLAISRSLADVIQTGRESEPVQGVGPDMTTLADMRGIVADGLPSAPIPDSVLAKLVQNGLTMVRTSSAAPEQYEVFQAGRPAGYVRVRWSGFTVDYPAAAEQSLYDGTVDGFAAFSDGEREECLSMAIDLTIKRMAQA